jgi:hypothetical protein
LTYRGGRSAASAHPTPAFLAETPFDTRVTKSVKRAYSAVDKLSMRIGDTLRRYPAARIFVIAYMVREAQLGPGDLWRTYSQTNCVAAGAGAIVTE